MTRAAWNPYLVLSVAMLLPGMGHVMVGATRRGLMLQGCMILGGLVTWHLAPAGVSLVGKLAGGLFVYALSLPEAYRLAKLRSLGIQTKLAAG